MGLSQNILTLFPCVRIKKISLFRDAVVKNKGVKLVGWQKTFYLEKHPKIKGSFLSFTVGVFRREKSSARVTHISKKIGKGISNHIGKKRIFCYLKTLRVNRDKLSVVIKHFLEVGNNPFFIGGVTRKPSTQLVIQSSFGHLSQRQGHHVKSRLVLGS